MVLNDEMDDFVAQPGVPNAFGLVGGEANANRAQEAPALQHDADHPHRRDRRGCSAPAARAAR